MRSHSHTQDAPGTIPVQRLTPPVAPETRAKRLRRHLRRLQLHGYAIAVVVSVSLLVALAAANTASVRVDWLVAGSRVPLVWLVLVAAIIGWILGALTSARFQWLTRTPRPRRDRNAGRRNAGNARARAGSLDDPGDSPAHRADIDSLDGTTHQQGRHP